MAGSSGQFALCAAKTTAPTLLHSERRDAERAICEAVEVSIQQFSVMW